GQRREEAFEHRQVRHLEVDDDVPTERRHARGDALEHLARGEVDQEPHEIEAYAAHAGAIHRLEFGIGDLLADEGDALSLAGRAFERIDHRAIVLRMTGCLHDDVLVEAEKVAQREQLLLRRVTRGVFALARIRKFAFGPEPVAVRIDGARRRRKFRLRRIGMKGDVAWTHRHGRALPGLSLYCVISAGARVACAPSPPRRGLLVLAAPRNGWGGSDPSVSPVTPHPNPRPKRGGSPPSLWPVRALSTPLQRERDALAHADAHGGERKLAAALLQTVHRGQGKARPRHAERVPERDRAAVRIDVLGVIGNAELAQAGDALRGERLVDLDQIEIADLQAKPRHQLTR